MAVAQARFVLDRVAAAVGGDIHVSWRKPAQYPSVFVVEGGDVETNTVSADLKSIRARAAALACKYVRACLGTGKVRITDEGSECRQLWGGGGTPRPSMPCWRTGRWHLDL